MEDKVVTSIPGIEMYPIVSLLIFVAFFIGLIIWTFFADRKRLEAIALSPLSDEDGHNS